MTEINYEALGRKVSVLYPDIARQLIVTPTFSDLLLIPEIYTNHFKGKTDDHSRFIFIAVILQLFDPDVLTGWKSHLRQGVRVQIANIYSVTEPVISHNFQTVRNFYTIYRNFKKSVDYIATQIIEEYASK